jgi:addiction module HigA family antidote
MLAMIGPRAADGYGASRRARLTPGLFLETRVLKPLNLSQEALAKRLGVSRRRINEIVRGRRAITADTALRLGHYFGTGPEFWLSLQQAWDTHQALRLSDPTRNLERYMPDK